MNPSKRGSVVFGVVLIALGAIFLVLALIPGVTIGNAWPLIFYLIAAGFYVPAFLIPEARQGLAALFIPGSVFLSLGLIFTYTVITNDWVAWAYAWLLIIASVGLGLILAASLGGWGKGAMATGTWMLAISTGLFGLFATIFGAAPLKIIGAVLVIAIGVVLLFRASPR